MERCKTLLISTPTDIRLISDLIEYYQFPLSIHGVTSVKEALEVISAEEVDLIMLNPGIVVKDGREGLFQLGGIPIVVISEVAAPASYFNFKAPKIHFITRPFEIEKMPEMFMEAYNCWRQSLVHGSKSSG